MSESEVNAVPFSVAMNELQQLVAELDEGSVDVDELADRFEKAIALVEDLDQRILRTKERIDQLVPRLAALQDDESR